MAKRGPVSEVETASPARAAAGPVRLSAEYLHLVVLPTEACNFRCVYCYEDFQHKQMEPGVVRGIKGLLTSRAPRLETLHLSWFGGEPLLARGVIEDIMTHARELAKANPRLRLASEATTNGYLLTRPVAERHLDLGVTRYQISFDGPREWHDRKRVLAGGRGTFDAIWRNLQAMRDLERDFRVTVRVHVDRENAAVIPQFIDLCAAAFGSDSRFEMFIRGLSKLGGANDDTLAVFETADLDTALERLRSYALSRGLRLLEFTEADNICYAARPGSYVVRANGDLNKCTVALKHPNNRVGRILEDGTVRVDAQMMLMWMRGLVSGSSAEMKCPMKNFAEPVNSDST